MLRDAESAEQILQRAVRAGERRAASVRKQLEEKLDEGESFRARMHDTLVLAPRGYFSHESRRTPAAST